MVDVAFVLVGIDPPTRLDPMVPVLRRTLQLLGDRALSAAVSLRTGCPSGELPERAGAARTELRAMRRSPLPGQNVRLDLSDQRARELFATWAPWSESARVLGTSRKDPLLFASQSGRSLWATLSEEEMAELDTWMRARALGRLVDMGQWVDDVKRQVGSGPMPGFSTAKSRRRAEEAARDAGGEAAGGGPPA